MKPKHAKAQPPGSVEWSVRYKGDPKGVVRAQTWYVAREEAYRTLGLGQIEETLLTVERTEASR